MNGSTLEAVAGEGPRPAGRTPGGRSRRLPLYLRIEDELAGQIEEGALAPGARVPTERDLSRSFGVSRMTVRAALARLAQRGLIVRRQGSGTVVAEPKLRQDASRLRGFFESSIGQGVVPRTRLLERSEVAATRHLADLLGLPAGDPVYKVVRVRSARGVPVVLETSWLPARFVPGLIDLDLESASIYRLMERHGDARPVRATQTLEPIAVGAAEAAILGVAVGSPAMLVERTAWDARGRAVEHARDVYRGDRSRFVSELTL
jgi:GntR family transcriptional regulator